MSDRWHMRCDTCGAYADGNKEPVEFVAWRHKDSDPDHAVVMWPYGRKAEKISVDAALGVER